jgi:hypothetical protein
VRWLDLHSVYQSSLNGIRILWPCESRWMILASLTWMYATNFKIDCGQAAARFHPSTTFDFVVCEREAQSEGPLLSHQYQATTQLKLG